MPFDGSGNFQRVMNWVADAAAAIKIRADRHDQEDDNFASGLSMCLTKDGQTQPTANIPMNGKKITNLAAPTVNTDAVNKAYVDAIRNFSTSIVMTGNDGAGRIRFSGTGNLGLSFEQANLSMGVKQAGNPAGTVDRFVWMPASDYSGTPIMELRRDGRLNFGTNCILQWQGTDKLLLAETYGHLQAPSFYIQQQAGDTAAQVIFRDSGAITRARFGYSQATGRSIFDVRNAAGAIINTLELGNNAYLQTGNFVAEAGGFEFPAAGGSIFRGGDQAIAVGLSEIINFVTTLRVRAGGGATATNITLQDSAGTNRGVVTADMANARTTVDYRNNAGAVQQSIQISAAAGLTVTAGANAGDIVTTGNLGPLQVFNGGSTVNTAFPVGTTLLVNRSIVTPRNASVTVSLDPANSNDYVVGGAGATLPGIWRGSGNAMIAAGQFIFNATRTQ